MLLIFFIHLKLSLILYELWFYWVRVMVKIDIKERKLSKWLNFDQLIICLHHIDKDNQSNVRPTKNNVLFT